MEGGATTKTGDGVATLSVELSSVSMGAVRAPLAVRVAWYRTRATFAARWPGYVSLALLIGMVGGLAMGAIAGARRTQSSFPAFMGSTNPPQLDGVIDFVDGQPGAAGLGWDPARQAAIAKLAHVERVVTEAGINTIPLPPNGVPISVPGFPAQSGEGSGDTSSLPEVLGQPIEGHLPVGPDEFVVSPETEQSFHLHVGQQVTFAVYTNHETLTPGFGTDRVRPYRRIRATLVGVVVNSNDVIQDQVDQANDQVFGFDEALTRPLLRCCTIYSASAVLLQGGSRYVSLVRQQIYQLLPQGFSPFAANPVQAIEAKAERAIKPESIALAVFGAIAGLAALVIGTQMAGRQLRLRAAELGTLRALGAGPAMTMADGLIAVLASVLAGALLALGVAIALSPFAPLGPVRPVYPGRGIALDWTVLGGGMAFLLVVLSLAAWSLAYRQAPHRAEARLSRRPERPSVLAGAAASWGLSAPAVTGIRLALEPGTARSSVPVRSAIIGAALGVFVVVATVTFGASLNSLVSHPALYGWNWDYEVTAAQHNPMPGAQVTRLLDHDRSVASWSPVYFITAEMDGQPVAGLAQPARASVAPPVLSGHAVDGPARSSSVRRHWPSCTSMSGTWSSCR